MADHFSLRGIVAGLILGVGAAAAIVACAVSMDSRAYDPSIVRFALSSSILEPDVNPDDALAAAKVWSAAFGASVGAWSKSEAQIVNDITGIVQSIRAGDADVVSMSTQEYLEVESELRAEPALAYVQSGQVDVEYVVIVRKDSDIRTPSDLKGKRIVLGKGGRNCLTKLWLDVMLADSGLPPKETLFKEIKEAGKTSKIVLPVFFRQIDAGITTKIALETAIVLNPQIGHQIMTIAISPHLVTAVTCFRKDLPQERKNVYISQALRLHETPGGLQTFTIFKMDRLLRWDPHYLDTARDLFRKQGLSRTVRRGSGRSGPVAREER
jgi:ABC-type phosphate/phosphonate transport system substrate-binding protein